MMLRMMKIEDANDLFEIFSNPHSVQYWLSECKTLEETQRMMRYEYLSYRQRGLVPPYVIEIEKKVVGVCCFNEMFDGIGRVGFILNEKYEHQGIMHQALKQLIQEGFEDYELHRIEALIMEENQSSRKCLERLNFINEGVMRSYLKHHDVFVNVCLYSLIKEENR